MDTPDKSPSTLVEIADTQSYTLERLANLEERLGNVTVSNVTKESTPGQSLIGGSHVNSIASTQHEINSRINSIINSLVL